MHKYDSWFTVEAAGTDRMAMPKAREWLMYDCP